MHLIECPTFVYFFQVTSVSCGGNHTVALTEIGEPYSFGSSSNGQLGLGTRILETGTGQVTFSVVSTICYPFRQACQDRITVRNQGCQC